MTCARLSQFAARVATLDTDHRFDAFHAEAIETGGTFVLPHPGDYWGSHLCEIQLHQIVAHGSTADEAIANWIKAAGRVAPQAA